MDMVTIRKATVNDLEILYAFEQGVIAAERPFDTTLKSEPIQYYNLPEMIRAAHIELAVAEWNNSHIIASGYARIEKAKHYLKHPRHAYLGFMYVLPQYRGQGINKKIIEYLKNWAALKNITELRLDVYFANTPAIKAYEKTGFAKHMLAMRLGIEDN